MRQDILSKMDQYFDSKKPNETNLIFLGSALIIAYLVYMLCFDPAQNFFDEKLDKHTGISTKLENIRNYLASLSSPDGDRNFKRTRSGKRTDSKRE